MYGNMGHMVHGNKALIMHRSMYHMMHQNKAFIMHGNNEALKRFK